MPRLRREKSLARARDHIHPRLARDFFEKSNVAPDIIRGEIDDRIDAGRFDDFEPIDSFSDEPCSTAPRLRPSFQDVRCIGNVLMSERKPELRDVESSQNCLSSSNAAGRRIKPSGFRCTVYRIGKRQGNAGSACSFQEFPTCRHELLFQRVRCFMGRRGCPRVPIY